MAEQLRAAYRGAVPRYRQDDESEVQSRHHRRLWTILRSICLSFPFPIAVLDAGCGTGRYFHCLENVDRLIGLDVSPDMLKGARDPVLGEQVSARRIDLICDNIFHSAFPPGAFDFIYSLGMFGNGCPVTSDICERFFTWLKAGGKLFFDVLSVVHLPWRIQMRRSARNIAYPLFPPRIRRRLDQRAARMPLCALTRSDLEEIMGVTSFSEFDISVHRDGSPRWGGAHLECLAVKS